jgi:hypothetical protein
MTNFIQRDEGAEAASAPKPTINLAVRSARVVSNVTAASSALVTRALRALPNFSGIESKPDAQSPGEPSNARGVDSDRFNIREPSEKVHTRQPKKQERHNETLQKQQEEARLNEAIDLLDDAFAPTLMLQQRKDNAEQRAARQRTRRILGDMSSREVKDPSSASKSCDEQGSWLKI